MKKIVTHSGTFHVDELFAIALLARFHFCKPISDLKIIRTRNSQALEKAILDRECFVIDVGEKYDTHYLNFDHHQNDERLKWKGFFNVNGEVIQKIIPQSSCGLIWCWLIRNGNKEMNNMSRNLRNHMKTLVQEIDISDNGVEGLKGFNEVSNFSKFNRKKVDHKGKVIDNETYERMQNEQFKKALQMAEWFLDNFIFIKSKEKINKDKVKVAIRHARLYDHNEVLFFKNDQFNSKRLGCIYSKDAKIIAVYDECCRSWSLKIVNEKLNSLFKGRAKMPKHWSGLKGDKLKKISGFYFANFCHKERFAMTLDDCSKEECLNVCYAIINSKD